MPNTFSVSHSFETGNIVNDLLGGHENDVFLNADAAESIGFLISDAENDYAQLVRLIQERLDFPLLGFTTMAFPLARMGDDISARLVILSKRGLKRGLAISPLLDVKRAAEQMRTLHDEALKNLGCPPKIWMIQFPVIPGYEVEAFMDELYALTGEVPVCGGMPTDSGDLSHAATFAQGEVYTDRVVLLGLGGDIHPVFATGCRMTLSSVHFPQVTRSECHIVHEVDNMPFCSYLADLGLGAHDEATDKLANIYGTLPVIIRYPHWDDCGVPQVRSVSGCVGTASSGVFWGAIPEGSRIGLAVLERSDVLESTHQCLSTLVERMKQYERQGYVYTTLFGVSCVYRYFAQIGGDDLESAYLKEHMPHALDICSFYSLAEIGPVFPPAGKSTEENRPRLQNRILGGSLVLWAI